MLLDQQDFLFIIWYCISALHYYYTGGRFEKAKNCFQGTSHSKNIVKIIYMTKRTCKIVVHVSVKKADGRDCDAGESINCLHYVQFSIIYQQVAASLAHLTRQETMPVGLCRGALLCNVPQALGFHLASTALEDRPAPFSDKTF